MKPIQAKIQISDGKINDVQPCENQIIIVNESGEFSFKDSFVYPGFVDSHGHILGLGIKLSGLNFNETVSPEECVDLASNHRVLRGDWLVGRGWNQELWTVKEFPDLKILDSFFLDNPVYFIRVDGHAAWVNSKALEIAGINLNTPDPDGGQILKFKDGRPNGILLDNAMVLVHKYIPGYTETQLESMIIDSMKELSRNGITEVHDMDVNPDFIKIFKKLDNEDKCLIRIRAFISAQNDEWVTSKIKPFNGKNFNICGLKFYADGALGSRGAALLEPYSDAPGSKGLLLISEKDLFRKAKAGIEAGFHIAIHAIGDAANRMVIDVYEKLYEEKIADSSSVLRIEHAQIIHHDDLKRFQKNRIYCAVQPVHCLSDAPMARKRLGNRINYSYPWASLIENGAIVSGGSDFPIESHNPLIGIDAFVRRIPFNESESWQPNEKLTVQEAIDAYTINAHLTGKTKKSRGKIEIGNDADMVILDKDLTTVNDDDILKTKINAVFCKGKEI